MRIIKALPYLVVSGDDAPIAAMNRERDPASNSKSPQEVIACKHEQVVDTLPPRCDLCGKELPDPSSPKEAIFPDCAMCAPCAKCDDECGCVPGPCWWCGHSRAEVVVEAIFGKPSGNVVWKGAGTI